MPSWLDFAQGLLATVGAPDTHDNEAAILTWMAAEQPPDNPNAANNPLNIQAHGYPREGAITGTSGSGQFNFADWNNGISQTANFLSQSRYAGILASLRGGAPAAATLSAIQSSGWAESGYGGRLPGLLSSVTGHWSQYANGRIAGAPPGTVGGAAAGTATATSLLNPGGTITDALKSLLAPFFQSATRLGILIVGVGGAVTLVVLGGYRAVAPTAQKVQAKASEATETAGKVAAVAG